MTTMFASAVLVTTARMFLASVTVTASGMLLTTVTVTVAVTVTVFAVAVLHKGHTLAVTVAATARAVSAVSGELVAARACVGGDVRMPVWVLVAHRGLRAQQRQLAHAEGTVQGGHTSVLGSAWVIVRASLAQAALSFARWSEREMATVLVAMLAVFAAVFTMFAPMFAVFAAVTVFAMLVLATATTAANLANRRASFALHARQLAQAATLLDTMAASGQHNSEQAECNQKDCEFLHRTQRGWLLEES